MREKRIKELEEYIRWMAQTVHQAYHTVGKIYFGECPACHGTGLKAVEDWTDAEKAERLREIFEAVWIHYGSANEWSVAVLKEGAMNGETIRHSPDFSAALTAAVIAVAEGEK